MVKSEKVLDYQRLFSKFKVEAKSIFAERVWSNEKCIKLKKYVMIELFRQDLKLPVGIEHNNWHILKVQWKTVAEKSLKKVKINM